VIFHKTFKYRIYPTPEQEARLLSWQSALRFLWNLSLEQWKMGLSKPKGERIYPSRFQQSKEVTALRAELPWLEDTPRESCTQVLVNLETAWQRCFKKTSKTPRFKKKGGHDPSVSGDPREVKITSNAVKFPKLGLLKAVLYRPIEGKIKKACIQRDGNQWFVCLTCAIDKPAPEPRHSPVVAIDRGITHLLADSDGNIHPNHRYLQKSLAKLARAQRTLARRRKGSKRRAKAAMHVANINRTVRRQRQHVLHCLSRNYANSHGIVVLEDLNIQGMGKNRSLARSIHDVAWGTFETFLKYKLEWTGGTLLKVPAHFSSQTCYACGHVDRLNRVGVKFLCIGCGHSDHADLNAAKVLKIRANCSDLLVEASGIPGLRNEK
jgi:putative transposase